MQLLAIGLVLFAITQMEGLGQETLASRLTLNCINNYVEPQRIHNQQIPVTIIDVSDSQLD